MIDSLIRDLRFSIRLLAARPGWTAAAILCLTIATGANTAAFSLVNGLLLRPLPFDDPDRLVMVALREPLKGAPRPFALREYEELSSRSGEVAALLARTFFPLSLSAGDGAQMTQAEVVSANYFEALRVAPFAGRFFDADSGRPGSELQGVLSHALWVRRFGADPAVIGQSMRVNGRPMIVAGIAPPGFVGAMQLVAADLWLPAAIYRELAGSAGADAVPAFGVMGRLAATVTEKQAEERLTAMAASIPQTGTPAQGPPAVIVSPATGFGVPVAVQGLVVRLSGLIYVTMALLMAVACANVAALVLARGTGRTREVAVRLSLGASRSQIARQLLTESLVLALVGSAAGVVAALWLTQVLVARLTTPFQYVSYAIDVRPDAAVFLYCAALTAAAAILCGVAPIRHARRVSVVELLKQAAAKGGSRQSRRSLSATVVVQFAVSTMLLVGAGMMVRVYRDAQSAPQGVQAPGLIAATVDANQVDIDRAAGVRLYEEVLARLSALPGVAAAALTRDVLPGRGGAVTVTANAAAASARGVAVDAVPMLVSPDFFRTVGITIRQGRSFSSSDPARTAVIDEAMARRLWPGASPIGRTFTMSGSPDEVIEVVGTVPDASDASRGRGAQPVFYRPFPQEYSSRMTILLRAGGDPAALVPEARRTIAEVNRDVSLVDLRTVDQMIEAADAQRRLPATVLSVVGSLAVLLSAVGLYGVVAYGVRQRAHELGIRIALGARPADVSRLILRQGFMIVGIGLALGILGAVGGGRVAQAALFGVNGLDGWTMAAVCALLSMTGFVALYVPARWASRLEPARTLRDE